VGPFLRLISTICPATQIVEQRSTHSLTAATTVRSGCGWSGLLVMGATTPPYGQPHARSMAIVRLDTVEEAP
jgi:hypothetical protein